MSKFSVKKPYTIVVAVIGILVLGIVAFTRMTTDLLPELTLPYLVVMTTYPGASPEKVEQNVTKPQEAGLATINQVERIQSISSENYAVVILEFSDGVDMGRAMLETREELDVLSGSMEEGIGKPVMMQISPDMLPIMVAAVDADGYDTEALSVLMKEEIAPYLEGVDGVASVSANGLIERTENIVISQEKIAKVNAKLREKIEAQLSEAEAQLLEAKAQLEAGKAELEGQMAALQEGSIQADQGFLQGRMELVKMELAMSQSQADLQQQKAILTQLNNALPQLETLLAGLDAQNGQVREQIAASQQELAQLQSAYDTEQAAYEARSAELTARLEELGIAANADSGSLPEDPKAAEAARQLAELTAERGTLEARKQEIALRIQMLETTSQSLAVSEELAAQTRKQLADAKAQLAQASAAVAEGEAAIGSGSAKVGEGKNVINQQEADTRHQLEEAGQLLESASAELQAGEKELNSQIAQFDQKKAEALEQAALDGILTPELITGILTAQHFSMPAGYLSSEDGTSYLLRVGDEIANLEELQDLVLFDPGMEGIDPVLLSDVTELYVTDNTGESYARVDGNDGLMFTVQKQNTYSTADVAHALEKAVKEIEAKYEGVHITCLMNQGDYIDMVVESVLNNLLMGGVLAILILLLFLKDIRPTFMIACSIPVSVVFAIVCMYFAGVTLNLISLSGLAVGVGMLVDNSVVVIENIYRLRNKGANRIQAAVSGAAQVAGAITASTLTTICVFLPIVFVEGMTRQLFQDMALTIAFSLLASLIVAMTLVPMMASKMLTRVKEQKAGLLDRMLGVYEKLLYLALKWKPVVLIASLGLLIGSAMLSMSRGTAYLPESDSYQMSVSLTMPEDTQLEDTIAMSDEVIKRLTAFPDVDKVGATLDSINLGFGTSSKAVTMYVLLKEDKKESSQTLAREMTEACADLDCKLSISGSTMDVSALGSSGISIEIRSQSLKDLQEGAALVAERIAGVEGTQNVSDGIEDPSPELHVIVDKNEAMKHNLTVAQVFAALAGGIAEPTSSVTITDTGEAYPLLIMDGEDPLLAENLNSYTLTTQSTTGETGSVQLSEIAQIEETTAFSSISRNDQKRYLNVTAEVAEGYNVGLVSRDVEAALADLELPEGTELVANGENETIMEAMEQLVLMLVLGILCIYLIMVAQFQSFKSPFIVLFTMPLAATGGFLGLYFTGNEISVVSMIGFVMLAGIVVNNGIVLVDYINQLRLEGVEKRAAILEAGKTRLRPILMTALTTVLGLMTMAMGIGSGADLMAPIAIVTIGGLLYATLMTLFVIPVIYDLLNRKALEKVKEEDLELLQI